MFFENFSRVRIRKESNSDWEFLFDDRGYGNWNFWNNNLEKGSKDDGDIEGVLFVKEFLIICLLRGYKDFVRWEIGA